MARRPREPRPEAPSLTVPRDEDAPVEIQPLQSRGRRPDALTVLLPTLALAAVVATGLWGAKPASDVPTSPGSSGSLPGRPSASAAGTPVSGDEILPRDEASVGAGPAFPDRALGLPVRTAADAHAAAHGGGIEGRLVAVRGWLTVSPSQRDCSPRIDPAVAWNGLCARDALLSDSPEPLLAARGDGITWVGMPAARLHVRVHPGTSLAALASEPPSSIEAAVVPVPVVVVGRFHDPRLAHACVAVPRHCRNTFAVERLMWVDGTWTRRMAVQDPDVPDGEHSTLARMIFQDSLRDAGVVLGEALVSRDRLASIDAIADAQVPPAITGPVWYMRVVVRRPWHVQGVAEMVHWLVVDHASGKVVAIADSLAALALRPRP
jgi:hypothetical protein